MVPQAGKVGVASAERARKGVTKGKAGKSLMMALSIRVLGRSHL